MKIYRVEIVNNSWSGANWFLEKYYESDLIPKQIKKRFEKMKKEYLKYYSDKVKKYRIPKNDDGLGLWAHYRERKEFLDSYCNVEEIKVIRKNQQYVQTIKLKS